MQWAPALRADVTIASPTLSSSSRDVHTQARPTVNHVEDRGGSEAHAQPEGVGWGVCGCGGERVDWPQVRTRTGTRMPMTPRVNAYRRITWSHTCGSRTCAAVSVRTRWRSLGRVLSCRSRRIRASSSHGCCRCGAALRHAARPGARPHACACRACTDAGCEDVCRGGRVHGLLVPVHGAGPARGRQAVCTGYQRRVRAVHLPSPHAAGPGAVAPAVPCACVSLYLLVCGHRYTELAKPFWKEAGVDSKIGASTRAWMSIAHGRAGSPGPCV